jgi:hypothetical protein
MVIKYRSTLTYSASHVRRATATTSPSLLVHIGHNQSLRAGRDGYDGEVAALRLTTNSERYFPIGIITLLVPY